VRLPYKIAKEEFRMAITPDKKEFKFQTDWIEKKGFFLVLAFFLGGLGAGLYLVSLYLNFYAGMLTAFLIVAVGKGGAHLIFLGRPLRCWRGFAKPQNSWISRGLLAIVLFLMPAAIQLAPGLPLLEWLPWAGDNAVLNALVAIGAVALMLYSGFALAVVKAIRLWNSGMIPVLFILYSFLGGIGLGTGMLTLMNNPVEIHLLERFAIVLLISVAVIWGIYLWTTYETTAAGRISVIDMIKGRTSLYFLGGVIVLGFAIPLVGALFSLNGHASPGIITVAALSELIGGFSMRYSIFKAGAYAPLT
jgi:formate-dependent nitrite reductase membrane component NrfD